MISRLQPRLTPIPHFPGSSGQLFLRHLFPDLRFADYALRGEPQLAMAALGDQAPVHMLMSLEAAMIFRKALQRFRATWILQPGAAGAGELVTITFRDRSRLTFLVTILYPSENREIWQRLCALRPNAHGLRVWPEAQLPQTHSGSRPRFRKAPRLRRLLQLRSFVAGPPPA